MQNFELLEKLKALEDQAHSLEGDIKTFVAQFIETHRTFKDGQKVEVFDFPGRSYGIGFIKRAYSGISFRWGSVARQYAGNEEKWLRDLCDIMYEIVKMKKDGTPSERNLMWDKPRQEKKENQYHLIAVE